VARVLVEVSLPHLDRVFDYLVTAAQSDAAQPGVRCRVRFAGQLVGGFVLERVAASEHPGRLGYLERVLGSEPVLSAEIAALGREVADRWAGSFADVVRLAVPPRHAAMEKAAGRAAAPADGALPPVVAAPAPDALARYSGGGEALTELGQATARRVWAVLPGDWPGEITAAVSAVASTGRSAIVVVPDATDLARVDAALTVGLGPGRHVALAADLGPAERYRRFLAASRGQVAVVVGTRAAVWAPVRDLGLIVIWDDGDDLYAEPRAPYCNARDVAVLRAHRAGASLLLAGHAVTAEGAQLLATGWASELAAGAPARAQALPGIRASGGDEELAADAAARAARLPSLAWRTARDGLATGPVLIQVPRRGYQPGLGCGSCRRPALCRLCSGPLARRAADEAPVCGWCGVAATAWRCPHCESSQLRAVVIGARRTAEELGRAFPNVAVRTSGGGAILDRVDDRPALVVATPGAEPVAAAGYAAAILLDGWLMLSRPDLRAAEEAVRRWLNAASLVRGNAAGGRVVVVAPGELRPVQALIRWQPRWFAERELEDRRSLHLPPAGRMAAITGAPVALAEVAREAELPIGAELLGPVPAPRDGGGLERLLIRVPRVSGLGLAESLKALQAARSARKAADPIKVELDPAVLG
jgi:primosomal protein N' (replication factor Y)